VTDYIKLVHSMSTCMTTTSGRWQVTNSGWSNLSF